MTQRISPIGLGYFESGVPVCSCGYRYPTKPQKEWTDSEVKAAVAHQQIHSPMLADGESASAAKDKEGEL